VGPAGDDQAFGLSKTNAWRSLAVAAERLAAGDTLYVLTGTYVEPLVIRASGTVSAPVVVRAYGRAEVRLSRIEIHGAHVEAEGFAVQGNDGDGVLVTASNVVLRRITAVGCSGAGVCGRGAADWIRAASPEQGTVHGAGLLGLLPDSEYEYVVAVLVHRNG
jgi:hypothetical protein